ncbi:HAMP domain-containing protein [Rhizobium leguminosarum]|uniref:methyl-accepting chemotaxis protein n=1 Tax=Rhizobium leguminosarum TaxID=384 RepID=UPI0014427A87|nr:methyl-accepting chemotaxis protein [Rhizobium leguminosarum]MBY5841290.1 HAMP domain-containing protein [Rhizobium leguminosarum]NKM80951.1 HAMP domain-containing protein [Rhizobium leguminosarum bv. viciae]QSZ07274.1 HAMP domain-containing protein [Rhizobium leguminosarum]
MLIDKILSHFKIKTKVLIFVLPFVLSISAVGLTGLYASGLLQGRMEISNSVLQSLTGFKNLYTSMDEFLQVTTLQARDKLYADVSSQEAVLAATLDQVGSGAQGHDELADAISKTAGISTMVDRVWTLYRQEIILRKTMVHAQEVLTDHRLRIDSLTKQLEKTLFDSQAEATAMLRSADRLSKGSDLLMAISDEFAKAALPAEKLKAVKYRLSGIAQAQSDIEAAMPPGQNETTKSLADTIMQLTTITNGIDAVRATDQNVADVYRLLSRFQQLSNDTRLMALQMRRKATGAFVEIDNRVAQVNLVLQGGRRLESRIYSLQLALGNLLSNVNKDNLLRLRQEIILVRDNTTALDQSTKGMDSAPDNANAIISALASLDGKGAELMDTTTERNAEYVRTRQQLDQIWGQLTAFAQTQKHSAGVEREQANSISVLASALGIILSIAGGTALVLTLQRPIGQITAAMRRIAEGRLETSISGEKRYDEIGDIARALGIFKENAIAKIRIEEQSDENRAASDHERLRNDSEKRELDRQIDFAVTALASGLDRLSQGDISSTIDTPFNGRLEQLRQDFNSSMARLQQTLSQVRDNVEMIQHNGNQMAASAEDLSKRTEQQAASLEETAAAVDQITVTVRSSAERAKDADAIVREAKRSADDSSTVVSNAIGAMSRIEDASRKIEQIIGVIDEIAFQTNLLALNAGIEAARAGDSGKGFAVVAMEVRELAQRSAVAAQEIKVLINKSTHEVNTGSQFVQQTGTVLSKISSQIVTISQHVEMIARAGHDQSSALQEVNATVNQMDQMTQQNAAMVEQTTAASRELAIEADALMHLIQQFKIVADGDSSHYQAA